MNFAYTLFGGAFLLITVAAAWRWGRERWLLKSKTAEERVQYNLEKAFGPKNPVLFCQHCQKFGSVRSKHVVRRVEVTVQTGNIVRSQHETSVSKSVTQLHCELCGTTWDV